LIADVVEDNYAFQWKQTELDTELKALLDNPAYLPIVVFPHVYAQANQCIKQVKEYKKNKRPIHGYSNLDVRNTASPYRG
jgi:DTW domain-containing protein YfiP